MRYSIRDEDLAVIKNVESSASEVIEKIYNDYVSEINAWGQKLNSELVLQICRKSIGIIDEEYFQALRNFLNQFDEMGSSFISISKRYKIGDEALGKVSTFQNDIIELAVSHNCNEISFTCDGEAKYSSKLINEYKEINDKYLAMIESAYDEHYFEAKNIRNENILGDGIDAIVKYQFETFQKIYMLYDKVFEMFLEWYERTVKENMELLETISHQLRTSSEAVGEGEIEKLLSQILDENTNSSNGNNIGAVGNVVGNSIANEADRSENVKKSAEQAVMKSVDSLLQELDTPEKIKNFKDYYNNCQHQYNEYKNENNKGAKKGKFQKFCDFIKKGAKKFGKPVMKALGIIVPLIAPEGHIVGKIVQNLPQIMDCFSGTISSEADADKVELGLECMKSIGVDKFPENAEDVKKYFEQNADSMAKDIVGKILNSDRYMNVLGIDSEELSKPANQKVYKDITGKDVKLVPQKRKSLHYDFDTYDPAKLKSLAPIESIDTINDISSNIMEKMPDVVGVKSYDDIESDLRSVMQQSKNNTGYIVIPETSKFKKLIEELRNITNAKMSDEILRDIDGRYNKDDIMMLCDEIEREKKISGSVDARQMLARACKNFIRRQAGYPAEYDAPTVKEIKELIPVLNMGCDYFEVDNDNLLNLINNAQIFINSKNVKLKKKTLISALAQCTGVLGGYIGIGVSIMMATLWPLGIALAAAPLCAAFIDNGADAYSSLVYNLGEDRADYLLKSYKNVNRKCFQFV